MPIRKSEATWEGKLQEGKGKIKLGNGTFEGNYSFASRFEQGDGTNPEELIAAAHAGCFSMALAHNLEQQGHIAERIHTIAKVHIEKTDSGFKITTIELETEGKVANIEDESFIEIAEFTKRSCPVSRALAGTNIKLKAKLA